MSLGLSLCLRQVTTCGQELRLDTDDSCLRLRETDLPRSARVLRAAPSGPTREAIESFVREHWHDRAILDFVLWLLRRRSGFWSGRMLELGDAPT